MAGANATFIGSRSLLRTGYVVGGGIEFPLLAALSVRAEFLHYDIGKQKLVLNEVFRARLRI